MALYKTSELLGDVREVLDKNSVSELLTEVVSVDTLDVNAVIRGNMVRSVQNVHTTAPVFLLEQGHTVGDELYWNGDCTGWLLLPDDFMRFMVFQMSDWERPCYECITPDDPEYALQRSRWSGVRGTPQKPVCALCVRQEGKVLEFYTCKSEDAYVYNGCYMPYPVIEDGRIDIAARCYEAAVYECAALSSLSLGDATTCALLRNESRRLLQLTNTQPTTTEQ